MEPYGPLRAPMAPYGFLGATKGPYEPLRDLKERGGWDLGRKPYDFESHVGRGGGKPYSRTVFDKPPKNIEIRKKGEGTVQVFNKLHHRSFSHEIPAMKLQTESGKQLSRQPLCSGAQQAWGMGGTF